MAFWSLDSSEPKRNFRFQVIFTGLQNGENQVWWAKKITKPNFTITETAHKYLNHTFYYPGRVEWQAITMTLVDPVTVGTDVKTGTVATLNRLMEHTGYKVPTSPNVLETQSKKKSAAAAGDAQSVGGLGQIEIIQMNADGIQLEKWILKNPFLKKISYGELDYENDELTAIEVELRYDWASCKVGAEAEGEERFSTLTEIATT